MFVEEVKKRFSVDKRRLPNRDVLSLTETLTPKDFSNKIKDPKTEKDLHHSSYRLIGEKYYILTQRELLEILEEAEIPTVLFNDEQKFFPKILEDNSGKKYFLTEKHFPLLIETRILSRAIKDYLSRNQFFNEGQNLPSLTTEFFIYRKKEKHLLKSHGQNIYGMYDRNVFNCFLDEEIDLKNFIGSDWRKVLDEMEYLSEKVFAVMKKIFNNDLSEVEIEFAFEKNYHYEGQFRVQNFRLLILNIDIEIQGRENISHKRGRDIQENERFNKNLLEILLKRK